MKKFSIEKNVKLTDIDDKTKQHVRSYLVMKLVNQGSEQNILDTAIGPRYRAELLFNSEMERFAGRKMGTLI